MNIFPVGADSIPTVVTRLDTTEAITLADGTIIENSILENNVTSGTEVIDVEDMPRQGVLVYFTGEKVNTRKYNGSSIGRITAGR